MTAVTTSATAYSLAAYLSTAELIDATACTTPRTRGFAEGSIYEGLTLDEATCTQTLSFGACFWGKIATSSVVPSSDSFLAPDRAYDAQAAEIAGFLGLSAGWDGEEAAAPNSKAIKDAIRFLRMLDKGSETLEPTLHVDGSVILEIGDGSAGSFRFRGDGTIISAAEGFKPMTVAFDGVTVPEEVQTILSA